MEVRSVSPEAVLAAAQAAAAAVEAAATVRADQAPEDSRAKEEGLPVEAEDAHRAGDRLAETNSAATYMAAADWKVSSVGQVWLKGDREERP